MFSPRLSKLVLCLSAISLSYVAALPTQKRQQCASTLSTAESVATQLHSAYYNPFDGMFNGGELWTDAVITLMYDGFALPYVESIVEHA